MMLISVSSIPTTIPSISERASASFTGPDDEIRRRQVEKKPASEISGAYT
jgi:hypothetical protein